MGLAPMAVMPAHQRKGIGSAIARAGLEQCKQLGFVAVVVVGHPAYYPRFGFSPSTRFGIGSEYEVPEEVFMAMELQPAALSGKARDGDVPCGVRQRHDTFGPGLTALYFPA